MWWWPLRQKASFYDSATNLNARQVTPVLLLRKSHTMKTPSHPKSYISLGDLVASVSSYARNEREVVAAIGDLFRKGSVVAKTRHGSKRLKLA